MAGIDREDFQFDNLIAADFEIVTDRYTIVSGQNLVRGTLLGRVTATGKLKQCDSGNSDGSQNPHSILIEDTDATGGDKVAPVYLTGAFNQDAIGLVSGDTPAQFKEALRGLGIYLKSVLAA